jgi:hypothetical protein
MNEEPNEYNKTELSSSSYDSYQYYDNISPMKPCVIDMDNDDICIENIQHEDNLISYTNNHFVNKTNLDLNRLHDLDDNQLSITLVDEVDDGRYSPTTIHGSPPESVFGSNNGSDDEDHTNIVPSKYRQLDDHDIQKSMDKYYDIEIENKLSNELDIITTYMKGQKHLFLQSKQLYQWRLNCLRIPSLLLTAFLSLGSSIIPIDIRLSVISIINGIITLLISLTTYMKLETYTELYLHLANQYDKTQTLLELANNTLSHQSITDDDNSRLLILQKTKDVISETKEKKIFIPAEITALFPIICHINIFSFINKMEIYKAELITNFKDVKNEIRYTLYKWNIEDKHNKPIIQHERNKQKLRLNYLYDVKTKMKSDLSYYRHVYGHLDILFTREIKMAERRMNKLGVFYLCFWLFTPHDTNVYEINPILNKYIKSITIED